MPHLLTIPRELRNNIYKYLYDEVSLWWDWSNGQDFAKGHIVNQVAVRFHNAPCSSIIRAHSRLCDEYIKSAPMQDFSATIEVYPSVYANVSTDKDIDHEALAKRVAGAFESLRKITVILTYIDALSDSYVPGAEMWASIKRLIGVIKSKAPHLSMVRVAFKHVSGPELARPEQRYDAFATAGFLPAPPTSLVEFPLVQRAEGYHVLCQRRGSSIRNTVVKYGAYVFSLALSQPHYFTSKEMSNRWNIGYNGLVWREKKGDEAAQKWT
ncbi:hypothetical protein G6011_06301 [Alternaria panax]|uniref:Uncharacterized protein n=1 Tax=Alternaria panax TaxID=48097 RepID=A0AAD4I7Y4_9PLEO|nr:hypothetical protein G6011_06301 [Alternaria panax]